MMCTCRRTCHSIFMEIIRQLRGLVLSFQIFMSSRIRTQAITLMEEVPLLAEPPPGSCKRNIFWGLDLVENNLYVGRMWADSKKDETLQKGGNTETPMEPQRFPWLPLCRIGGISVGILRHPAESPLRSSWEDRRTSIPDMSQCRRVSSLKMTQFLWTRFSVWDNLVYTFINLKVFHFFSNWDEVII